MLTAERNSRTGNAINQKYWQRLLADLRNSFRNDAWMRTLGTGNALWLRQSIRRDLLGLSSPKITSGTYIGDMTLQFLWRQTL